MAITTETPDLTAQLRLFQLVSPSLPVGAFSYSQGIEWAVEAGWIGDAPALEAWLVEQIDTILVATDLALLVRLFGAVRDDDPAALAHGCDLLLACRESRELRDEERNRGRALAALLVELDVPRAAAWREQIARSQLAGFALAAVAWSIPLPALLDGYAWSWLENGVLAGVKLVPLGQTAGQRLLHRLAPLLPPAVARARRLPDDALGASLPALAIASSRHETQYTRLFRS